MATFIYSPAARLLVDTEHHGTIDLSQDLVQGDMRREENRVARFGFSIMNRKRMYDRVFMPNDRVSLWLKRTNWVLAFSGYLDTVPVFSSRARTVSMEASCTLKRLKFRYWDAGLPSSVEFIRKAAPETEMAEADGGMRDRVMALLSGLPDGTVGPGGWDRQKIHISALPQKWFSKISQLYDELAPLISQNAQISVGSNAVIAGNTVGSNNKGQLAIPQLVDLARSVGLNNDQAAIAAAIAMAESGGNPESIGDTALENATWGPSVGLWQIRSLKKQKGTGQTRDENTLRDPAVNAKSMMDISARGSNWKPWSVYTKGLYKKHLPAAQDAAKGGKGGGTVTFDLDVSTPKVAARNKNGTDYAWGNYKNGMIPTAALMGVGPGHFLHPTPGKQWLAMQTAAQSAGVTISLTDSYRNLQGQKNTYAAKPGLAAVVLKTATEGKSVHGWGFAADINIGGGGYTGVAYKWLAANAHRFGWANPAWAQAGGKKPEPWHWEYMGEVTAADLQGGAFGPPTGIGTDGFLLNSQDWPGGQQDDDSEIFGGIRRLMNDHPLMDTIEKFVLASQRSFCSAPNGDFIAWFPDYFGAYGHAAKMVIEDIELHEDFSITWGDMYLITHQFTVGAESGDNEDNFPGGFIDPVNAYSTSGIASIEFPQIMKALFGHAGASEDRYWKTLFDPNSILARFGARPNNSPMSMILHNPQVEFWYALHLFQRNWAQQFSAPIRLTFMPELFPGMLIQIPSYGFQAYVASVTHRFSFEEGGPGFETDIIVTSPSATDGSGLYGLQRAGAGV